MGTFGSGFAYIRCNISNGVYDKGYVVLNRRLRGINSILNYMPQICPYLGVYDSTQVDDFSVVSTFKFDVEDDPFDLFVHSPSGDFWFFYFERSPDLGEREYAINCAIVYFSVLLGSFVYEMPVFGGAPPRIPLRRYSSPEYDGTGASLTDVFLSFDESAGRAGMERIFLIRAYQERCCEVNNLVDVQKVLRNYGVIEPTDALRKIELSEWVDMLLGFEDRRIPVYVLEGGAHLVFFIPEDLLYDVEANEDEEDFGFDGEDYTELRYYEKMNPNASSLIAYVCGMLLLPEGAAGADRGPYNMKEIYI